MARTREFNADAALDAAMMVFWRKGYDASSIEDLVEATGVSRYGLYGIHESKHGLFIAALDYYRMTVVQEVAKVLHHPDASLDVIVRFVKELGEVAATPAGRYGCLLWNSASEVASHDVAAAQTACEFKSYLLDGFRAALKNAIAKGELSPTFDTSRTADFLGGVAQGLAAMARSNADDRAISNFVAVSLSTLS